MNLARYLAKKTKEYRCAYLSTNFVNDLEIEDSKGVKRKFNKILWDYIPDSDSEVLKTLGVEIAKVAKRVRAEIILGIATSGVNLASVASLYAHLAFGFVRKKPKNYGLKNYIEGHFGNKKKVLLVDNFSFTGGTIMRAVSSIKKSGLKVVKVITIDTFENIKKVNGFNKLPYKSLIKNSDKIDYLIKQNYFPKELEFYVKTYIQNPDLFFGRSDVFEDYKKALLKYISLDFVLFNKNEEKLNNPFLSFFKFK